MMFTFFYIFFTKRLHFVLHFLTQINARWCEIRGQELRKIAWLYVRKIHLNSNLFTFFKYFAYMFWDFWKIEKKLQVQIFVTQYRANIGDQDDFRVMPDSRNPDPSEGIEKKAFSTFVLKWDTVYLIIRNVLINFCSKMRFPLWF